MALKFRRGSNASRQTITPAEGELLYVTDHVSTAVSPMWVGDGSTAGGRALQSVVSVNGETGTIVLTTANITEGTNKYYLAERAQDDVASLFTNGTHSGNITFTYQDNASPPRIDVAIPVNGSVNSGTANTLGYYASTGDELSSTTDLTWNNTSNVLSISEGRLVVTASVYPQATVTIGGAYNSADSNSIKFQRSRGSTILPTAVTQSDRLFELDWFAYDGTTSRLVSEIGSYVLKTVSTGVVPTGIGLWTTGTDGVMKQNLRVLDTGKTIIGPGVATEPGTGSLLIASTSNPQSDFFNNSALGITQFFDGADCQNISMLRSRGTWSSPLALQNGDEIGELAFYARDTNSITTSVLGAQITASVDGAVSTGVAPGALTFFTRNTASNSVAVMKISAPSTSTTVGRVLVNGTIATTSTPATFWNYDSSGSTLTLTLGQVVTFASFSGSVLVNCYTSGNVSQYLCGSGGTPTCIGSSNAQTGSMQAISGGYTFTASEAGEHSFYVIRTRAGA